MTVVRGQFHELLVPGANAVYVDEYTQLPSVYDSLLNVMTSTRAFEDDLVMTGLPAAGRKHEGEPIPFDRPRFRGKVRYVHGGYGLGYEITEEAVEDELYGALTNQGSRNLAWSMRETEEIVAHTVFNLSFTTVLTYDGQPLISDAHEGVGLTFSNRPVSHADLSVAQLKAAMEHFFDLRTDRNMRVLMSPSNLLVSNTNYYTALEILGTPHYTGASSGGETSSLISTEVTNVVQGMGLTPIRSPYLTDPDAWWVMVPKAQHKLKFWWRRKPTPKAGTDERVGVAWYGMTARFVAGATEWRGIYGSSGAG